MHIRIMHIHASTPVKPGILRSHRLSSDGVDLKGLVSSKPSRSDVFVTLWSAGNVPNACPSVWISPAIVNRIAFMLHSHDETIECTYTTNHSLHVERHVLVKGNKVIQERAAEIQNQATT